MNSKIDNLIKFDGNSIIIEANGTEEALLVLDELHARRTNLSEQKADVDHRIRAASDVAASSELKANQLSLGGQIISIDRAIYQIKIKLGENGLKYINNTNRPGEIVSSSESKSSPAIEDTEERYRQHLAYLISRTKSRGHSKYYNNFLNRCRAEAAAAFPRGAAAAKKKDFAAGGILAGLSALFSFFG